MILKTYQQDALDQLSRYLDALKEARAQEDKVRVALGDADIPDELKNHPQAAWSALKKQGVLPAVTQGDGLEVPQHISRTAASGAAIPHVCMKVPTGGGKTLLGVAALERLIPSTGFALWIVPTKAIYEQTIHAFRAREHPYRQMLERISSGRVKVLEKTSRFTRQDTDSYLCVMMLMLPSANRQKGREFLKIFRDSGGYTSFFPEQDDRRANEKFCARYPDLEKSESGGFVKQSLINALKVIRPYVILDEAHKAYGKNDKDNKEFVKSVNRLNPRFVLELSATPKIGISNILVNIGGLELKNEEMIKLPIEIHNFSNSDWKRTLAETQSQLRRLEAEARKLRQKRDRYVRPIALVRVQRTGKEQRGQKYIHAEDAREYLIKNLSVPEGWIRVQSSERKELAREDLLSEMSEARWIITKEALKEGWDCSFAYILALLDNTKASTAITQMVGRVMRQPHACAIEGAGALNRCYVYCYNEDIAEAVEWVKTGLEKEGLTGLGDFVAGGRGEGDKKPRVIKRRKPYQKLNIFLPQVLHQDKSGWRPLDYDRDILGSVNWETIKPGGAAQLDDADTITEETEAVDISDMESGEDAAPARAIAGESLTVDYFVRRLLDLIPNPWQAARIAAAFIRRHEADEARLLQNRVSLSEVLIGRVREEIDGQAERVFRDKIRRNEIRFHLVTDEELNYAFQSVFEVSVAKNEKVLSSHGRSVQRSLFDTVFESEFNKLEKDFAFYLDESEAIFWWHKVAARRQYSIQGWRRHKVYPDFVVCRQGNDKYLVLETKGLHLKGSGDTEYKKALFAILENTYKNALDRGEMNRIGETPATYKILFEDKWKQELREALDSS